MSDDIFKDTVFLVEATDFETHMLWAELHDRKRLPWEQDPKGVALTIGRLNDRPIVVSFMWHKIDGYRVCFYHACSQLVDHQMVREWIDAHFVTKWDSGTRRAVCNGENIHHMLHHLADLKRLAIEEAES